MPPLARLAGIGADIFECNAGKSPRSPPPLSAAGAFLLSASRDSKPSETRTSDMELQK